MKNLFIAVFVLCFSLSAPLSLAQDSEPLEQGRATVDVASDNGMNVDLDISDSDELAKVLGVVREVAGDKLADKLDNKLEQLDDEERTELKEELGGMFEGGNINIGGGGFGDTLVTITAIVFSLGMPVIILLLVLLFGHYKRKQKMQLITDYIAADKPVPEHVLSELSNDSGNNSLMRSGLTYVFVGVALAIVLGLNSDLSTATIGLIPLGIGIARLLTWKYEQNNLATNSQNNG